MQEAALAVYLVTPMHLTAAGATVAGPRPTNQDAHLVDLSLGLLVVADGMGGHLAGDVASRLAVDTVVEFIRATHGGREITWPFPLNITKSMTVNRLEAALRLANRRVRDAGQRDPRHAGMGTTIVAALVDGDTMAIGHVGDSRAYVLRDGDLVQVTQDHTWVNAVLGGDARQHADHPMRHVLTNGIGMGADLTPSVAEQAVRAGERWLMCTDGVHGYVEASALRDVLVSCTADAGADEVIRRSLAAGTTDNATVVILNVD